MKTRILFITALAIIGIIAIIGGFTLMWRLFITMALLLLLSFIWAKLNTANLSAIVKRSAKFCYVGDSIDEEVILTNHSRLPGIMLKIREKTSISEIGNETTLNMAPRSSRSWKNHLVCRTRGLHQTGSFYVHSSDPLNIFKTNRRLTPPETILVYPSIVDLPYFDLSGGHYLSGTAEGWARLSETGSSAARVREYGRNDRLTHIYWPATAHTGKLMVKEFDPDRSNYFSKYIWLVPDMQETVQAGKGKESTEEYTVTITASLLKKYTDNSKQVGLATAADREYCYLPTTGNGTHGEIMERLATIKASGTIPIDTLLVRITERIEAYSSLVVITPAAGNKLLSTMQMLNNRGVHIFAVILDSTSFGGRENPKRAAEIFNINGIPAFIVRQGIDISKALDTRRPATGRTMRGVSTNRA